MSHLCNCIFVVFVVVFKVMLHLCKVICQKFTCYRLWRNFHSRCKNFSFSDHCSRHVNFKIKIFVFPVRRVSVYEWLFQWPALEFFQVIGSIADPPPSFTCGSTRWQKAFDLSVCFFLKEVSTLACQLIGWLGERLFCTWSLTAAGTILRSQVSCSMISWYLGCGLPWKNGVNTVLETIINELLFFLIAALYKLNASRAVNAM